MAGTEHRVAIVGAGIAGLACAGRLREAGVAVSLFDKGRGPGGRCATRRAGAFAFDHGAQYFTASDERFRRSLASTEAAGFAVPWRQAPARLPASDGAAREDAGGRWIGVPGMNGLARHLGQGLQVRANTRIVALEREGSRWRLRAEDGSVAGSVAGTFDGVVVAVPAPQAVPLLAPAPALAARAQAAVLAPCWALMLAFAEPLPTAVAAAFVGTGRLSWVCHDGGKPGRAAAGGTPPSTWVAHASPAWSRDHLEADPAEVAPALLEAFAEALGLEVPPPVHLAAHRWRFAKVEAALGERCLYEPGLGIGACGDWCLGPRVEAAFLSGLAMAERVLAG